MKKMTKILLAAGGAALICGGAAMTYLKAQTPMTIQEELTLANLEAMALDLDENMDQKPGLGDCDNYNGYRRIKQGNERIYDCCYVVVIGVGKEDCKGW